MKPNKLFEAGCNLAPDYGFFGSGIEKFGQYVIDVEVTPLKVTGSGSDINYDWNPPDPNAYGVYLRYSNFAIEKLNVSPSEWIADFSSLSVAERFKNLVIGLLTAHMSEEDKEELAFKIIREEPDAGTKPESQVPDKKVIDDQLMADLESKWKDIFSMGYSHNFLNDGRAEQWQLFLTPLNDYLMLGEDGDVQEYTYYSKADLDNDLEALESHFHTFTEI